MRVVVAMSGGVDSAVACALVVRAGYQAVGVTLHLADLSGVGLGVSRCCSLEDVESARAVCAQLGVPHYVLNMEDVFRVEVLDLFVEGYLAGRTPSPCVRCNSRVKFGQLLEAARTLGGEAVASGHYARRVVAASGEAELWRGVDRDKDQSYFLFELTQTQLQSLMFPLGELTKRQVRQIARELELPVAEKPDSQEVCFVPPGKTYREVLAALASDRLPPEGEVVDQEGRVLGRHPGFVNFTVGQRRGLGVATGTKLYVVDIIPTQNRVVVGEAPGLAKRHLAVEQVNWLIHPPTTLRALVQVRSRHSPQQATLEVDGESEKVTVTFDQPVVAPTPGQAAVFYCGERVLGGGYISRAW
ncbi:MAG: tRNA 2-thiouridine(34) synthase MnmA [Thermoanaerobaculum sp.]|nr:tRNA 2-thiouridine(34) synthase MnmA [Thermoanaerobaculum sp.]MDW7966797.1 tRNA 2-thiouridine(34) synthase MnmA [Thermoanaerobaculum sp.]